MRRLFGTAALGASLAACAGPANVAGTYTGNVVNGTSTCPGTWTNGQTTAVELGVAQSGGNVTVEVRGLAGLALAALTGAGSFSGTVVGDQISATLVGNRVATQDTCRYTVRVNLSARLTGNTLEGTVTYTPEPQATTMAECVAARVTGCTSGQTFNGLRPPPAGP